MHPQLARLDDALKSALWEADGNVPALHEALEMLPAPIYVTDADGVITFFNSACVGFTGRHPAVGKDRWCVTWKLYTEDGAPLAHDQCPMATAIGERRENRGALAVAERPDGTRVTFTPFPTLLFNTDGEFTGAVNMLIDVTDYRQIAHLKSIRGTALSLAERVLDTEARKALKRFIGECDQEVSLLESTLSRV